TFVESQNLAGVLGLGADANGAVITGLGAPANAADAATKDYVDGQISGLSITASMIVNDAGIQGSKIFPEFNTNVLTTGNFATTTGSFSTSDGNFSTTNGDFLLAGIPLTPDFVFEKYFTGFSKLNNDYQFKNLKDIEEFIKVNHHLPGVRSADEIMTSGKYRLGESSLIHLEKIEELFLHTIEQEKKIDKLQSENKKLSEELN